MTAEERAAVEWLEELPEAEHVYHFRPPAGEVAGLFSVKHDHERTSYGRCYRCNPNGQHEPPVVIE